MLSWDHIRAFLALHRAGTFEGAARTLGIDHSTLRRRIQALEQSTGASLFVRQDGCYAVKPSMCDLLEAALRMETTSRAFFDGASSNNGGAVRVTMLDAIAGWLAPDITAFRKRYPNIYLDLGTEHHFVDLEREMVDVAIRLARPTRGNSRLRKLAEISFSVYAAPVYLERHSQAEVEHDLITMSVHFTHRDHDFLVGEADWMLQHLPPGRIVCATDSYLSLREYCKAGMGLTLLPDILVDENTGLVRFSHVPGPVCDLWLLLHSETGSMGSVRLFANFITETFQRRLQAAVD